MALSERPVPSVILQNISLGRYGEAADALAKQTAKRPSAPLLVALAAVNLELGKLSAAKKTVLKVVEADPQRVEALILLARIRAALDEREAALADFRTALDLSAADDDARAAADVAANRSVSTPVHAALHNLEQIAYLEEAHGLPPGALLPVSATRREDMRREFNQMLDKADIVVPSILLGGEIGSILAKPPRFLHNEAPPVSCLNPRNDWGATADAFANEGGIACLDNLLNPTALAQLQRFCLRSTVWRRSYRHGYVGAFAEFGFFNSLILQIAAELKHAIPDILGNHHLAQWWAFVYQHQRPGTDIHADQSDVSLNLWITPDAANLQPGTGGLDIWGTPAPADWTFDDYNGGRYRIRANL